MIIKNFNKYHKVNEEKNEDYYYYWAKPLKGWDNLLKTRNHSFSDNEFGVIMIVKSKNDDESVYVHGSQHSYKTSDFELGDYLDYMCNCNVEMTNTFENKNTKIM